MNFILMGLYIYTYYKVKKANMTYIKNVVAVMICYTIAVTITFASDCGLCVSPQFYPLKNSTMDLAIPIVSLSFE